MQRLPVPTILAPHLMKRKRKFIEGVESFIQFLDQPIHIFFDHFNERLLLNLNDLKSLDSIFMDPGFIRTYILGYKGEWEYLHCLRKTKEANKGFKNGTMLVSFQHFMHLIFLQHRSDISYIQTYVIKQSKIRKYFQTLFLRSMQSPSAPGFSGQTVHHHDTVHIMPKNIVKKLEECVEAPLPIRNDPSSVRPSPIPDLVVPEAPLPIQKEPTSSFLPCPIPDLVVPETTVDNSCPPSCTSVISPSFRPSTPSILLPDFSATLAQDSPEIKYTVSLLTSVIPDLTQALLVHAIEKPYLWKSIHLEYRAQETFPDSIPRMKYDSIRSQYKRSYRLEVHRNSPNYIMIDMKAVERMYHFPRRCSKCNAFYDVKMKRTHLCGSSVLFQCRKCSEVFQVHSSPLLETTIFRKIPEVDILHRVIAIFFSPTITGMENIFLHLGLQNVTETKHYKMYDEMASVLDSMYRRYQKDLLNFENLLLSGSRVLLDVQWNHPQRQAKRAKNAVCSVISGIYGKCLAIFPVSQNDIKDLGINCLDAYGSKLALEFISGNIWKVLEVCHDGTSTVSKLIKEKVCPNNPDVLDTFDIWHCAKKIEKEAASLLSPDIRPEFPRLLRSHFEICRKIPEPRDRLDYWMFHDWNQESNLRLPTNDLQVIMEICEKHTSSILHLSSMVDTSLVESYFNHNLVYFSKRHGYNPKVWRMKCQASWFTWNQIPNWFPEFFEKFKAVLIQK